MATFGTSLRTERETRGITLEQIAAATRIGRSYLEALERDDLAYLPGGVFNRGFVRAYAQFLGLDPDEAVEAYTHEEHAQGLGIPDSEAMVEEMSKLLERRPNTRGSRFLPASRTARRLLLCSPFVALIAVAGWFSLGTADPADPTDLTSAPEPAPAAALAPTPTDGKAGVPTPAPIAIAPAHTTRITAAPPDKAPAPRGTAVPPPAAVDATGITVPEFGVGTAVVDRQLVGRNDQFAEGSQAHFWTRALHGKPGDLLRHVWLHDGRIVATVELTLGGPHWRTHSRKTLVEGATGRWAVEARDASGRVLARDEFTCVPVSPDPAATVSSRPPAETAPGGPGI